MNRLILSVIFSLLSIGALYSQFDPQFSQYMFNLPSYNPAAVGEGDLIQVTGQHRIQWADTTSNFGGQTTNFSINSPLRIGKTNHGIGMRFQNDVIGLFKNQSFYLQYAYKRKISRGVLSAGADLGLLSLGFLGSKVKTITLGDYYHFDEDDVIPKTDVTGTKFDANLGVLYTTTDYYAGLSYSHLLSPKISMTNTSDVSIRGTMYLTGGYTYNLPEKKLVLKPTGLFKTDFSSWQLDLSGRAEYDNKYWGGLSYRFQDAIVFLLGVNLASGLTVGYSFDLTTSHIRPTYGTHEVLLSYSFAYVFQKKNTKYKSIRIL